MRVETFVCAALCAIAVPAQGQAQQKQERQDRQTGLRAILARGKAVMGIDQYTARHQFDLVPDGARMSLRAAHDDSAGVVAIRKHFRGLARQFARGDFSAPGTVHGRAVPGTAIMAARRSAITYRTHELPTGAELWITTEDSTALSGIREFVEYQKSEHREGTLDSSLHLQHQPAKK